MTPVLVDAGTRREAIRRKVIEGLAQAFPLKAGAYTLELANPRVEPRIYSSHEQKKAILEGGTLSERVRGDLTVRDAAGAAVSHAKDFTLLRLPWFTPRHTFVLDGTEYSVSNQVRTKPGVYVRRRGNEELEATFNLAKGANFRLNMDPEKGLVYMQPSYGSSKIPLYPVLRSLGVPHHDIAARWGGGVADVNRSAFVTPDKHVDKLYTTLVHPAKQTAATPEERARVLREYFDNTVMDPEVTRETLGHPYDRASPMAMLAASGKLLEVHRAAADVDDRDSLAYKTFHSVDDFLKERILLNARAARTKLGWKLAAKHGDAKEAIPSGLFTGPVMSLLTGSSLSAAPMQINPMELIDEASRVTSLGEGAIPSEKAIPLEARDVHPTSLGILDPTRTPESFKVGVDVRATISTRRDAAGNLYAAVKDAKTGRHVFLKASDMSRSVVAFPGEDLAKGGTVDAMDRGVVSRVAASKVTHQIEHPSDLYGPTTNLLPLYDGMQGNRALMASKHQGQALSLVHREPPLVQVASWNPGTSVEKEMVRLIVPTAPVNGRIVGIDKDWIRIKPDPERKEAAEPDEIRLHYDDHFPLAAKTFLHNELKVKEGDRVTAGQPLAESNFTKNDTLALGTNLRVGYMPYRGLNSNDGIVISEGAADKLISEHMYRSTLSLAGDVQLGRERHRTYFGTRYERRQYDQLDEDGVIKPGTVVKPGDPLIVAVRKEEATGDAALLGRLSKSLVKPFAEVVEAWTHDQPGTVIDVAKTASQVSVTVKTRETVQVGDKLSGRYGNKGVIAAIVPNGRMIKDEKGRPLEILLTSAGINTRINPAQVVEAQLGKVAEHLGHPIEVAQYDPQDNAKRAKELLAKHGLKDKETVFDPITGRQIPGVQVGKGYFLKLFKTTDSNWSSHGAERYDFNQQPARGGDEGAKAIGKMEFDGLVAHNARNVLRESASIKSQRNDEFWRAVQLGLPTPAPQSPFAFTKFLGMLKGGGVNVTKRGSRLALGPLTDADITKMSSGILKDPHKMIRAKDFRPETGGLFDPAMTGGLSGAKWSHVELTEPIVNPVFEEPVRRLLGLTQKEFDARVARHGGAWFKDALSEINVDRALAKVHEDARRLRGAALDDAVKRAKYLDALRTQGLRPQDAYVLSKVPVTPPVLRPILPLKDGRLQIGDANILYRDAFLANTKLKEAAEVLPDVELQQPRLHLYKAVGALFGVEDPVSPGAAKRGTKGYLALITGTRPGAGFFQSKLMKRQQDVSGRATIAPDPTLSMDEIGVPEDMLWGMYGKFVVGRLVKRGYTALEAQKMVDDKAPAARQELINESHERPVIVNRAPSLHRFNVIGAYPKITDGKTLQLNPFAEKGLNADYDGDAMQIHAPVTPAGVADVKKMTLSHLLFSDRRPGVLNVAPDMEAVIGLHRATSLEPKGKVRHFASREEALAAYHRGEIGLETPVEVGG